MPATVTCPNCNVTLKPKTPVPAGTRIKCPKCQTVFAVPGDAAAAPPPRPAPAPAPISAPEPAEEDDAGLAAMDDDAAAPRGAASRPAKKGVPLWVWLVSGGGLVVLLTCCGCGIGGYYFVNSVVKAGSGSVTLLNYAQIQKGMSEAQVQGMLGKPATEMTLGGSKVVTWQDGQNTITVTFTGDQATDKVAHLFTSSGTKIDQTGFVGH